MPEKKLLPIVLTGIPELDVVLRGGLPKDRMHLLEGAPGTGKTTIGLRFLIDGVRRGERCMYVTFAESETELASAAATHGWDVSDIHFLEAIPEEAETTRQQTVLYPSEVDFGRTIECMVSRIEEANPNRLVIDSVSELRMLGRDRLSYRRQMLQIKRFLQGKNITTILLDDLLTANDGELHSLVHGVISLQFVDRSYGAARRRLRIAKMRGLNFLSGWHDYTIVPGEILVFPSLIAEEHDSLPGGAPLGSGTPQLDEVLGGGLDRGTTTMMIGPSGAGKSSIALCYALAGANGGEFASYFSFDETYETFQRRAASLGLDVDAALEKGRFAWRRMNPSRLSPGEFVWAVRRDVEDNDARVVVIDSINSYLSTMPEENSLILHLHELLTYLNRRGVVTIIVLAQQGVVGDVQNPVDLSFLSDAVLLLRFFEAGGRLRRAISVIKRRTGGHDNGIHEYVLSHHGLEVGPPLSELQGIFTGVPTYSGSRAKLLGSAPQASHESHESHGSGADE